MPDTTRLPPVVLLIGPVVPSTTGWGRVVGVGSTTSLDVWAEHRLPIFVFIVQHIFLSGFSISDYNFLSRNHVLFSRNFPLEFHLIVFIIIFSLDPRSVWVRVRVRVRSMTLYEFSGKL